MIVTQAELELLLNMQSANAADKAALQALHAEAESLVKKWLGYDPVQADHIEYYPRSIHVGGPGMNDGRWDVNATHTQALWVRDQTLQDSLQLQHIPVRSVADVWVDYTAKHGATVGAFATATKWTQGTQYWPEWDEEDFSLSGCLLTYNGWPIEPGTVKVSYRGGYSPDELNGKATASGTDQFGNITNRGIDAAGIKRAVTLTVTSAIHTWRAHRRGAAGQFTPGGLSSEKLQDYSYTADGTAAAQLSGMLTALPAEAMLALESFQHWGIALL